jgi:hypothetical protein
LGRPRRLVATSYAAGTVSERRPPGHVGVAVEQLDAGRADDESAHEQHRHDEGELGTTHG